MADQPFIPLSQPPADPGAGVLVFSVKGDAVHLGEHGSPDEVPHAGDRLYLGRLGDADCWAVDLDGDGAVDEIELALTPLMALHASVPEVTWHVAGRAVQLVSWARTHRFCGRCGAETAAAPGERAMRCSACGLLAFPRLAPAVITLVTRGDEVLLARNANFPVPMFSCLAGFVEPGETLEQCVAREVREEVGVEVGRIRYSGSQPWPFPHSLMIGFRAEWTAGEIVVDGVEISEAAWFTADDLPMIPPRMSIARTLIDSWLAE